MIMARNMTPELIQIWGWIRAYH